ncbi:MAG TPA: helix-turn-helix transcriptional regulator [Bacteroidales bacterium]|mgnify:FL=1|jgi:transcriptional regulator with XRE-family HTH domain|nr:helix-turn-helix transcriptional regulator [Bacteroidales bacterium]
MNDSDIKKRIRELRESLGYTQEDMANYLKMSLNSYRQLESGKTSIISKRVFSIAQLFNMSLSELIFGTNKETSTDEKIAEIAKSYQEQIEKIEADSRIKMIELEDENKILKMALESKESIIGILKESLNKYR